MYILDRPRSSFCRRGNRKYSCFMVNIFKIRFPFYSELKILFIFWLVFPPSRGYLYIYNMYIYKLFSKNEAKVDGMLAEIRSKLMEKTKEYGFYSIQSLQNAAAAMLASGESILKQQGIHKSFVDTSEISLLQESTDAEDEEFVSLKVNPKSKSMRQMKAIDEMILELDKSKKKMLLFSGEESIEQKTKRVEKIEEIVQLLEQAENLKKKMKESEEGFLSRMF